MSALLFYQLVFCAIAAAFSLFVINMNGLLSYTTAIAIIAISTVLIPTFIYCDLSERITSDLHEMANTFYSLAWYELPFMQQKCILLSIQRAQRGVDLTGLGIITCSLATFLSVSTIWFIY